MAVSGTAGSVAYVSGGTTVWAPVREWSLNITHSVQDITTMGKSWKEFIAGLREFDGSVSFVGDPSDSAETFVRNAIIGGSAAFTFRFYAGTNYYAGSALPKKFAPKIAYDGILTGAVDLQGNGAISYT